MMHKEKMLDLTDRELDRLIEDPKEFQCIVRYARSKK